MKLWNVLLISGAVALAGAVTLAQTVPPPPQPKDQAPAAKSGAARASAHADIKGEGITGTADFAERAQGRAAWSDHRRGHGLKPEIPVHLHAVGKCDPDFTAAGGHFDPGPASNPDPDANHPFHMGDIPNLQVGQNGSGTLKAVTTRVTISDGPLSLFDADGSAVIIHGNEDKGVPGEPKSGVSGGEGVRRS